MSESQSRLAFMLHHELLYKPKLLSTCERISYASTQLELRNGQQQRRNATAKSFQFHSNILCQLSCRHIAVGLGRSTEAALSLMRVSFPENPEMQLIFPPEQYLQES